MFLQRSAVFIASPFSNMTRKTVQFHQAHEINTDYKLIGFPTT